MSLAQFPAMLISETEGWSDIERNHPPARSLLFGLVMPLSIIPPAMYAFAEMAYPGAVFPLSVPAMTGDQLLTSGIVLFLVQLTMVSFMAMLIQRMAMAQDHDPGYENAYTLAAIAPVPLWLSSLALLVPSLTVNVLVVAAAWVASAALIRHGVRPLLKVDDARKTHYISNLVTAAGVLAWFGLLIISAALLSIVQGLATLF
ncbi:MAG: YIP1 family protein [Azonexus sp.]